MSVSTVLRAAAAAIMIAGAGTPALADPCGDAAEPSPGTDAATGIQFRNTTPFPAHVYWSDFGATLQSYGPLDAGAETGFATYQGHVWYVEVQGPAGFTCLGPIMSPGPDTCMMNIINDGDAIGMDGGFCDYR
jgi:hypothetical protein